jgi:excisionase family DNA binding protein
MGSIKCEIKKRCQYCGNEFIAHQVNTLYCSKKCAYTACKKKKKEAKKQAKLAEIAGRVEDYRDYISISEATAIFHIASCTLYRLIRKGRIPSVNLGHRLMRVSKTYLNSNYQLREKPRESKKPMVKLYNLEPENCYTIGEISEKYHVGETSVYIHIRKYSIPIRQIGRFVYAPKDEIDKLYNNGKSK